MAMIGLAFILIFYRYTPYKHGLLFVLHYTVDQSLYTCTVNPCANLASKEVPLTITYTTHTPLPQE